MTEETQEMKAQKRANQCRASVRLWRTEHEKHNDASSRRLLLNTLFHAVGAFDTLDALGLSDDAMRAEATEWAAEAYRLQTEQRS